MKRFCILLFLVRVLYVTARDIEEKSYNNWNISLADFHEIVTSGNALVVDVREPHEVETVRVDAKKYVNIPLKELADALHMQSDIFKATFNVEKPHDIDPLVFICRSGKRSDTAMTIARRNNYFNTLHYNKGTIGWVENYPDIVVKMNRAEKEEL